MANCATSYEGASELAICLTRTVSGSATASSARSESSSDGGAGGTSSSGADRMDMRFSILAFLTLRIIRLILVC